jgi:hypothetical protein
VYAPKAYCRQAMGSLLLRRVEGRGGVAGTVVLNSPVMASTKVRGGAWEEGVAKVAGFAVLEATG